jgi:hypothetical protein
VRPLSVLRSGTPPRPRLRLWTRESVGRNRLERADQPAQRFLVSSRHPRAVHKPPTKAACLFHAVKQSSGPLFSQFAVEPGADAFARAQRRLSAVRDQPPPRYFPATPLGDLDWAGLECEVGRSRCGGVIRDCQRPFKGTERNPRRCSDMNRCDGHLASPLPVAHPVGFETEPSRLWYSNSGRRGRHRGRFKAAVALETLL